MLTRQILYAPWHLLIAFALMAGSPASARADSYAVIDPVFNTCSVTIGPFPSIIGVIQAVDAAAPPVETLAGVVTDPVDQDWVTIEVSVEAFAFDLQQPETFEAFLPIFTNAIDPPLSAVGLGLVSGTAPIASADLTAPGFTATTPGDGSGDSWTLVLAYDAGALAAEDFLFLTLTVTNSFGNDSFSCSLEPELTEPDILLSDASVDFGTVELGSDAVDMVTVSNLGQAPLFLSEIAIVGAPEFQVTAAPAPGSPVAVGDSVDIGIAFAPTAEPAVGATLEIHSDDPDTMVASVDLVGSGVAEDLTVMEVLETTFDPGVEAGTIAGSGPGGSAAGRLGALRNKLEAAGDLIDLGEIDAACDQLDDVLRRIDGLFPPPDFADSPENLPDDAESVDDLAEAVTALKESIGCGEGDEAVRATASDLADEACGLGFELVFLLPPLLWLRQQRRHIH